MTVPHGWPAVSLALAIAGIGVASYLSYASFNTEALTCAIGDCGAVQASEYARIAGIPIALFGLGMYIAVLALGLWRIIRQASAEPLTFGIFALVLAGTGYAAYLTYIELWVIEAICQWCVVSALVTLGLAISEGVLAFRLLGE